MMDDIRRRSKHQSTRDTISCIKSLYDEYAVYKTISTTTISTDVQKEIEKIKYAE